MKMLMSWAAKFTCVISWSSLVLVHCAVIPPPTKQELIEKTKERCSQDYKLYYDHGTENCEQCREICQHAKYMGTEEQCERNCPTYIEAMNCMKTDDKYFDENVRKCSSCSIICTEHQHKGTTEDCREKCSAYLAKQTPEQVPSLLEENSLKAVQSGKASSDDSYRGLHPGWIATIVVGCVAVICTILVIVILTRTGSSQYILASQGERASSRQPVEETSQHEDSPHFAIPDTAGPVLVTTTQAFSDLATGPRRSVTNSCQPDQA